MPVADRSARIESVSSVGAGWHLQLWGCRRRPRRWSCGGSSGAPEARPIRSLPGQGLRAAGAVVTSWALSPAQIKLVRDGIVKPS